MNFDSCWQVHLKDSSTLIKTTCKTLTLLWGFSFQKSNRFTLDRFKLFRMEWILNTSKGIPICFGSHVVCLFFSFHSWHQPKIWKIILVKQPMNYILTIKCQIKSHEMSLCLNLSVITYLKKCSSNKHKICLFKLISS